MSQLQPTGRQPKEQVCGSRRHSGLTTPLRVFSGARAAVRTVGRAAMVQANEAAMLMSAAAMTPLRLASGGFDGASSSSPPVKACTASTTRPVLLVHGFAGTKSSWSSVAHTLSTRGLTVEAMSYPPLGTSVEQLADRLVAEVERILRRTGADKVHLVGHSLGGVVIAQAIADRRLSGRVDTVITLGSPFGGSPWAGVLPFVEIVRALRPGSPVLRRVAAAPMPAGVRWLSVTASLDIIVPELRSAIGTIDRGPPRLMRLGLEPVGVGPPGGRPYPGWPGGGMRSAGRADTAWSVCGAPCGFVTAQFCLVNLNINRAVENRAVD